MRYHEREGAFRVRRECTMATGLSRGVTVDLGGYAPGQRRRTDMAALKVLPREIELDGYLSTPGMSKNGVPFLTLRHEDRPTVTAFGEAAQALSEAMDRGGSVRAETYESFGSVKIVTMPCPITGLPIGEKGRLEPIAVAPVYEPVPEPKPLGFWDRVVDTVQEALGMEDDRPVPQPILLEHGRTGYPVVDELTDRIRDALVENPNLIDSSGGRFDDIADKHLPRLAAKHADTVRGADARETRLADAMFADALGVIGESFDQAAREHRSMKLDALAVEMNFIRGRQGLQTVMELQPSIALEGPRAYDAGAALDVPAPRALVHVAEPKSLLLQAREAQSDREARHDEATRAVKALEAPRESKAVIEPRTSVVRPTLATPTSEDLRRSVERRKGRMKPVPQSEPAGLSDRGIDRIREESRRVRESLPPVEKPTRTGGRGPKKVDRDEVSEALQRASFRRGGGYAA